MKYKISLDQLADLSDSTTSEKKRILRQMVNKNRVPETRFKLIKSKISKSIEQRGDLAPILDGIRILASRKTAPNFQLNDKKVSLEALKRFINIKLPRILQEMDYTIFKPKETTLEVGDVDIIVAPEIVIRGKFMGQPILGGIKIHISKNSPFDLDKAQYVSSVICKYLKDVVARKNDIVLPDLCFCLEVFDEKLVPAPESYQEIIERVKTLCDEVKFLWK